MYTPDAFRETRLDVLHALMVSHPFATLLCVEDGLPTANHLPLLLRPDVDGPGVLVGHVARANPVWRGLGDAGEAIALFQGPAAYVSPSWYPSKARHHKVVPTWNYAVVHAEVSVRIIEDPDWLVRLISELTAHHEASSPAPWQVSDALPEFIRTLVDQIVGIELPITRLTGKYKLSQNRPAEDVTGVIAGLRTRGQGTDEALASLMTRYAV